jgi:hypothetical protein
MTIEENSQTPESLTAYELGRQKGMDELLSRDALVVNLMRELKMNKHLARNCADVVMQMIYEKRNVSP